jgi:maleate cis-trans isomerase
VQTSASLFADNYDAVTVKRMTDASGVPSLTSAQALGRALKALKASRIAMATPYSEEVIGRARRYYQAKYGVETVASESLGATDAYAIGKMDAGMVEGRASTRWWCRAATSRPWTGSPPGSASSASQ